MPKIFSRTDCSQIQQRLPRMLFNRIGRKRKPCISPVLPDNAITGEDEVTRGRLILVTPLWPTQAWYPGLLDLLVSLPVLLPLNSTLLLDPREEIHPLIANQTLQLAAWHVSSDCYTRKAFVQTLPSSSWQLGGQAQTQSTTTHGKNRVAGVSAGKLIHFAPLWPNN